MRTDRILQLRDKIASLPPSKFNMSFFATSDLETDSALALELDTNCSATGCLAGWACALFRPEIMPGAHSAADILELTGTQWRTLFFPPNPADITIPMAVQALTNLINDGDPQWSSISRTPRRHSSMSPSRFSDAAHNMFLREDMDEATQHALAARRLHEEGDHNMAAQHETCALYLTPTMGTA